MFSSRIKWDLKKNLLAQLIEEKRRGGADVLDLTESNPTRAGFIYPRHEILGAMSEEQAMVYQPTPRGSLDARDAICGYYRERGLSVDPDRIHLTASTSEGYAYLFKLLADPGESVLVPQPSYPLFEFLAALENVALRPYELSYIHPAGWQIDFDSIENALSDQTRAIIVVNPNNPTGSFIRDNELAALNEICARGGLALIVDEVFGDYAYEAGHRRVASLVSNETVLTFVMSGLSKIAALPQMKFGWVCTGGPKPLREEALERLDLIADTFLSVSTPVQCAAPTWLLLRTTLQTQIIDRARDNLNWLTARTSGSPSRLLNVEGGWYATLEIPRHRTEEEWVLKLLEDDNVLIHPGYFFDFQREAFLITSLLPQKEIFREAIERMMVRINSG
jgi:alanine-synthesizing transaminase